MKLSRFNETILNEGRYIIYNTLTRRYLVYPKQQKEFYDAVFDNLNSGNYSLEEFEAITELLQKGIVLKNDENEIERLKAIKTKLLEKKSTMLLVIQPTLDCNFRCVYCYEEHRVEYMKGDIKDRVLKYIKNNIENYKSIHLCWFGGEPLLDTEVIKSITYEVQTTCHRLNKEYSASMTTNGYLFTDNIIAEIEALGIKRIQITVDGDEKAHDTKRPLADGSGTYWRVMDNLNKLLEKNIAITLRINIDKDNYDSIHDLLEAVPKQKRSKIRIVLSNLFKAEKYINTYNIYKKAIEKGYCFNNIQNKFYHCEVCRGGMTIDPGGRIAPCSMAAEKGHYYGYIGIDGELTIENEGLYDKIRKTSALEKENCLNCKELPMCMGGCRVARSQIENICVGTHSDLSLEQKIKLHYYSDIINTAVML